MMCAYIFFLSLCVFLEPLRDNTCSGTLSALSVYERHCKMSLSLSLFLSFLVWCAVKNWIDNVTIASRIRSLAMYLSFPPSFFQRRLRRASLFLADALPHPGWHTHSLALSLHFIFHQGYFFRSELKSFPFLRRHDSSQGWARPLFALARLTRMHTAWYHVVNYMETQVYTAWLCWNLANNHSRKSFLQADNLHSPIRY